MTGMVPRHLPQTAQAAEHCAMEAAAGAITPENTLVGDCLGVIAGVALGFQGRRWGRLMHGGCLRAAWASELARPALQGMVKVQAHQDLDLLSGEALDLARGNHAADLQAKEALLGHPQPSPTTVACRDAVLADAQEVASLLARASARWPRARDPGAGRAQLYCRSATEQQERQQARAVRRRQQLEEARTERQRVISSHDWVTVRGVSRCKVCLRRQTRSLQACEGSSARFRDTLDVAVRCGHRLWVADALCPIGQDASLPFVACRDCGAWSTGGPPALLGAQCRPPSRHGLYAIQRMKKGLFPRAERRWAGMTLAHLMPWPGAN